ncbi:SCP2 sterol-binding domain-containing protein [Neobacillus pocheonensis]|uniref:SCP2 sterol-binding domain-containing protein n=1 Tax=Neobacillus pocheonensis TaxID=363869 RepID=UPI003D265BF0
MAKKIEEYTLQGLMKKIEEILNLNPAAIQGFNASYQFEIDGEEQGTYQLLFQNGKAEVKESSETDVDCRLIMSLANFHLFLLGKLNGTMAFMTGKLKIKGDIGKAIKIENVLKQYSVKDQL